MSLSRPAPVFPPTLADDGGEAAALEIARVETGLARTGRTILDLLTSSFAPGTHYPDGEVWDDLTHAQYFYHAHPDGGRAEGEHGHFHSFLGQGGMPRGVGAAGVAGDGARARNRGRRARGSARIARRATAASPAI